MFVNGAGPFPFILDTGADGTSLYTWFAKQQRFPVGKPDTLIGQTGTTQVPTYRLKSISLDGRTLLSIDADGLPDRHDDGKEAGIIGNDLLDGAIAIFDFPHGTVHLLAKPVDLRPLVGNIPAVQAGRVKEGSQLTIPVTINGVEGLAVFDTGARDTRINTKFAAAAHIDTNSSAFKAGNVIYGATSMAMESKIGPFGTLSFAGVSIPEVNGRVMDLSSFETFGIAGAPAMTLGADVMSSFKVVYDHQAKLIWVVPSTLKQ